MPNLQIVDQMSDCFLMFLILILISAPPLLEGRLRPLRDESWSG